MLFQPSRKSFGVLFTAFPDTLRAFRLLRVWQHRALLRCASDQVCWKSRRLRRIRLLRLCEGNRYIVGGKGQHRRDENSDSSRDHAEQLRLCRDVDAVHCAHARWPHSSEGYCAKRPDASGFSSSGSLAILAAIRRAASRVSNLAAYSRFAMPSGTPPFDSAAPAPTASHSLARE